MAKHDGNGVDSERAVADDFKKIRDHELEEIRHRRREALPECEDTGDASENLVGLALSGGGIRSGAVALGVLQSLHERHLLPFIDYLSTVSGGGYAGAYLSSVALKAGRTRQYVDPKSDSPDASQGSTDSTGHEQAEVGSSIANEELFPIARDSTGQQQEKMLRFIHGGNYLQKTWVFFNRYLIGLFLIWSFVISGLVAITSLAALAFRSLDHTDSRAWIAALGFQGEIRLAFFPSFVLLIVWFSLWALSYLKYSARGTGIFARSAFLLLVFATLVAIAALLGNGEYDFPGVTQENVTKDNTGVRTLYTIIFAAIIASLLPYLHPARLVRSGTAPKNTVERYTFWVATRALVFGVPFIFVAFFARENISGWNERRDDRITRAELDYDNYLSSPLWRQVAETSNSGNKRAKDVVEEGPAFCGAIWRSDKDKSHLNELARLFSSLADEDLKHQFALSDLDKFDELAKRRLDLEKALNGSLGNNASEFSSIKPLIANQSSKKKPPRDPDAFANEADDLQAHLVESAPADDTNMPFPTRWWHLLKYFGESIAGDTQNMQENPVYRLANEYVREREVRWEIARTLNLRLEDPEFFKTLLPENEFDRALSHPKSEEAKALRRTFLTVKPHHPGVKFEDWRDRLRELRRQAAEKQIEFELHRGGEGDERVRRLEQEFQLSAEEAKVANAITKEERERLIVATNRRLLEAFYGKLIEPKSIVWSSVVLAADQQKRLAWFLVSLCAFVFAGLLVDLNATSWHGFYSTQIGKTWIEDVPGMGQRIPLTRMETSDVGRPYHLVNASVHMIGKTQDLATRRRAGFLFSKLYCGADELGYARTAEYMKGMYTLDDAIAVSGAAVSPVQTANPLVIALLVLFNVRLGQWVANPARPTLAIKWVQFLRENWPITPFRVLFSMTKKAEHRPTCFVADGGHHENLAVEPLLVRRCKLILAMDAGYDENYDFSDLANLIRIARVSHGISFEHVDGPNEPIDLSQMIPSMRAEQKRDDQESGGTESSGVVAGGVGMSKTSPESEAIKWSEKHLLVLKIKYPATDKCEATDGYLIYMKSTMTGDEPLDLRQYKKLEPQFPHDPTADQFYDPVRFDAYVELGFHIASQIGKLDDPSAPRRLCPADFINWMAGKPGSTASKQPQTKAKKTPRGGRGET